MQTPRFAICGCGRPMHSNAKECTTCLQTVARERPSSRPSSSSGQQPVDSLAATRRSPERRPAALSSTSSSSSSTSSSRTSSATEALTSAFASESPVSGLFPSNLYRLPIRAASNSPIRRDSGSSIQTTSSSGRTSRAATPDYAPMSAGFVRLGRQLQKKDALEAAKPPREERTRASLELEARMFSGPA